MFLHGNLMAAARALLAIPRPATPGLMAHLPETGGLLTLALGDPLGGGVVLDLPPPSAALHLHGDRRTDLTSGLTADLLQGAGNAARAWRTRVDLSAPGLHRIHAEAPVGRDPEGRGLVQHAAACFVLRGAAPAAPEPLGLAVEILPDLLLPGFLPGMGFSARVLAQGRALTATTVLLERVGAEPVGGQVKALPGHGAPLWIVAETDREGRFRVSLPAPGLWAVTATGPIGWSGLRPVRHVTTLWQRFGGQTSGAGKDVEALATTWEIAAAPDPACATAAPRPRESTA
ncbi:DUF4198 domain-containing protein [Rhodobacter capsulatus]|uniref:DUF4198 domain-containing protein n=1 Tax=Rhodobacter capsulatus TaxID=1061 RepID=A0A1G7NGQ2_RHOCA|nr:DUF4198 domain-containing protein [Rhodobacter capsulatus]WER09165.1 DUF4198 domain-containing protein [Rhodobacter capsulatus]SDF73146.1 protein of unknown function [Rhodobacter capsulatus]